MNNFDLKKYLYNNPLLNENLPKDKWVDLDKVELEDYKDDIISLIKNAYSSIGGHPNYKSSNNVTGSEGDALYSVIDLDDDDDIDAVTVSKTKPVGNKFVAMGHDGSSPAKRKVIKHKIEKLNKPGYYIEVSGKIKDILLKAGVPVVSDESTILKVLKGKEVEINDDGSYQRKIGGKTYTKILLGKPLT
jgi:hypothetical protein